MSKPYALQIRMNHEINGCAVAFQADHHKPGNALSQFEAELTRIVSDELASLRSQLAECQERERKAKDELDHCRSQWVASLIGRYNDNPGNPVLDNERLIAKAEAIVAGALRTFRLASAETPRPYPNLNPKRRMTYRFFDLPHAHRLGIAQQLGLTEVGDEFVQDAALNALYFARAKTRGLLREFWSAIEGRHLDPQPETDNPFLALAGPRAGGEGE